MSYPARAEGLVNMIGFFYVKQLFLLWFVEYGLIQQEVKYHYFQASKFVYKRQKYFLPSRWGLENSYIIIFQQLYKTRLV